ncbi:polygalacturonase-like [Phoenix dactylifera]|uniref:endo-polygalacturonase n=1 Tax=Phoenix dactylifera TaxID=42345 RepID=A0A8B8ZEX2_PHODC|nr:polygalacturonase-like [Phoenix dactylifera]
MLAMAPHKFLLLSLVLFSFNHFFCFSKLDEDRTLGYLDDISSDVMSTHPSYYGAVHAERETIKYRPNRFVLERVARVASLRSSQEVVNVEGYGAKGDGTDDTEAFEEAWKKACSSSTSAVLMVPENKRYLLKPVTFSGPCKSDVSLMIKGTIEASSDRSDWNGKNGRHWILFSGIENLYVGGGGTINGNGKIWWQNSCKIDKSLPCKNAPTAMTFYSCDKLTVENLNIKDSQQIHVSFERSTNVKVSSLTITAPEKSPNTDGIHVTMTKNIAITNCVIGTGDDCISIESGSQNVKATNIVCGPGHGISIGSLGDRGSEAQVSNVIVDTAQLKGTTNGARIKTWQGGRGYAKDIIFQNLVMHGVQNPIIIDQSYCDSQEPCKQQDSAVEVSNVTYNNIKGTSASKVAIKFDCSTTVPCHDIVLQDVDLVGEGHAATSLCNHVNWTKEGNVIPLPCAK